MKTLYLLTVLLLSTLAASALELPPAARAYLISGPDQFIEGWITASDAKTLHYRESEKSGTSHEVKRSEFTAIHFFEAPELATAFKAYRGGKYLEAREGFAAIAKTYMAIEDIPDNPATVAAFYELECLRMLDDLEGLAKALQSFPNRGLRREHQLRQLEIYVFWDAVRTQQWEKVLTLTEARRDEWLPAYQRSQIAYCQGLAHENLGRPSEALAAYQTAVVMEDGSAEGSGRLAALNALRIYKADPEIQTAIRRWGSPDENRNPAARRRLGEAAAMARLVEALGPQPLPGQYKEFLNYTSSN
jgi:tetratricopeptide (TPR) repeat protein